MAFPLISELDHAKTELYLENVIKELTIVRKCYLNVNPIIRIQRWWRLICRKKYRKWKIVTLPKEDINLEVVPARMSEHRKELDRLVTEKYEISRSNEEIVLALLAGNG